MMGSINLMLIMVHQVLVNLVTHTVIYAVVLQTQSATSVCKGDLVGVTKLVSKLVRYLVTYMFMMKNKTLVFSAMITTTLQME